MCHNMYDPNGIGKHCLCSFTCGINFYNALGFLIHTLQHLRKSLLSESVRLIEPTTTIFISKYQVLPVKSLISMEFPTCDLKSQTILNNGQDLKGNTTSVKALEESE